MGTGGGSIPFDQRLARAAVRPLVNTPITPNMLSLLGMVFGLTAATLFARGDAVIANWAAALFVVAVWMDHVDGEHARATGQTSTFGHYLDHVSAMTTYISMFVGVGIGQQGGALGEWAVPLGVAAGLAVATIFSVRMWVETRYGSDSVQQTIRGGFEIEDALYIVAPVAWLGGLTPFLVAAGIGAPLFLIFVIWETAQTGSAARQKN